MAMTLKSLAAQMRAYRPEADEYKGKHIIPSWADELDAIDAHHSAQAKVRVSDADFECIKDTIRNHHLTYSRDDEGDGYPLIDALSVGHQTVKEGLEEADLLADAIASTLDDSFAARLSQGAQSSGNSGELAYDDEPSECSSDPKVRVAYADGYEVGFAHGKSQCAQGESTVSEDEWVQKLEDRVEFLESLLSAERAAVPDGMVLVPREPTPEMLAAVEGMEISVRVAEDDTAEYPVPEDDCAEIYRAMLTAAPQPPEGARVVDGWQPIETAPKDGLTIIVGRDMGDFGFVKGTAYYEGRPGSFVSGWIARGFIDPPGELGLAHPTHWMPLPAAPTLAGKEGAK